MHLYLDPYHYLDADRITTAAPLMVEAGAFACDLARAFLRRFPDGRVEVYEADPINFISLAESAAGDTRLTMHQAALASADGRATLHTYTDRHSHSLFDRSCDGKVPTGEWDVRSVTLATALADVDRVDYLLLNCEGCELPVLEQVASDASLRERIDQICVSFHCRHSQMYAMSQRDTLLASLEQWYDLHVGNVEWEYFLLTKKAG